MAVAEITLEDFAADPVLKRSASRSRRVAKALDRSADVLPYAKTFTSIEFSTFLRKLTPTRFALLQLANESDQSIAELASASKRDASAVSRDVGTLTELGLVTVQPVSNSGHGLKKIVRPIARTISINAEIA